MSSFFSRFAFSTKSRLTYAQRRNVSSSLVFLSALTAFATVAAPSILPCPVASGADESSSLFQRSLALAGIARDSNTTTTDADQPAPAAAAAAAAVIPAQPRNLKVLVNQREDLRPSQ